MKLEKLTPERVPAFLQACAAEHVMGSRIAAALRADGPESGLFLFRPGLALLFADGVVTVAAGQEETLAADELPEGAREVDGPEALCRALHDRLGGELESSYFMRYAGGPLAAEDPAMTPGEAETVFAILQGSHEFYRTHLRYEPWRRALEARRALGLAEAWQLAVDGRPVGTGSLVSQDDECCVIGELAVLPPWRSRGLGSRMTRFLAGRALAQGKTPRLMAGYDEVAGMYEKLGFVPEGRWGELYL